MYTSKGKYSGILIKVKIGKNILTLMKIQLYIFLKKIMNKIKKQFMIFNF